MITSHPRRPNNWLGDLKIHLNGPLGDPLKEIRHQQRQKLSKAYSTLPRRTTQYWTDHSTFLHWWSIGRPKIFAYFTHCSGDALMHPILVVIMIGVGSCFLLPNAWKQKRKRGDVLHAELLLYFLWQFYLKIHLIFCRTCRQLKSCRLQWMITWYCIPWAK